jgi:hypothetical protein
VTGNCRTIGEDLFNTATISTLKGSPVSRFISFHFGNCNLLFYIFDDLYHFLVVYLDSGKTHLGTVVERPYNGLVLVNFSLRCLIRITCSDGT